MENELSYNSVYLYDVFQNGEISGKHGALKRGTSTSHRTTTENKEAAANVTAKSIWFKRQLNMAVAAVGSVALCATMAFVAALTGYVSSSDLDSAAYKMAASQAEITESLITDSDGVRKVYNSAAIAFPDGHTDSYQKMHRAGSEETAWSLPGSAGHVRDARVDRIGRQANQGRRRHLLRWPLLSGTRSLLCRVRSRTVPASDGHDRQRMVSRIPHGQLYRP